ncbi:MAG TPA: NUDIX hydrolase [Bacilli bacterium]|nr:NUDIX hydrolase [Bacilli bacterium]
MKTILELIDDQYPLDAITHTRLISRGVLINDKHEVALTKILDDDKFGHRDYYELPGGGVTDGEHPEQALIRELEEEVGYTSLIVDEIGEVSDYYNLIGRHNRNFYYLARVLTYVGQRLEDKEIGRIEKIVWVPIDEAIALYEKMDTKMISGLVRRRELPILLLAREMLTKG